MSRPDLIRPACDGAEPDQRGLSAAFRLITGCARFGLGHGQPGEPDLDEIQPLQRGTAVRNPTATMTV